MQWLRLAVDDLPIAVVLQEMVMLPLVYPEIFARFSIKPPRGVLFCGPPGKGSSLRRLQMSTADPPVLCTAPHMAYTAYHGIRDRYRTTV